MNTKSAAILGASGYAGRELRALIEAHPALELAAAMSARPGQAPEPPALPVDPPIDALDLDRLDGVDVVFLCTPHGTSAPLALAALERGARVVDLSADFRLRDAAQYERVYGQPHTAPELLAEAVYGLTEFARERVPGAQLVANPGCYPTSALLALKPLLEADLLEPAAPMVVDAKSGLTGAGRSASATTHFGNVHENFRAYGVGVHRHGPEICQEAGNDRVVFTAHLLPILRGILSTIYLQPRAGVGAGDIAAALSARYRDEPFVTVYERGLPELDRVQRTNQCHLGVAAHGPLVCVVSAIDNLLKGAAGQALQNANLLLGLPEGTGLGPAHGQHTATAVAPGGLQ
ncbi:N-acetyl-gamma-glutamyl-phosphate reductase [Engelhardtia mirabilis]|uniref:N-acetyl-gamma-glutamyl-phosphate reductase n=1 Tax=Engelhardtia mirabilis TaxID=2528011 RepID=A0A518BQ06_9BACT|nr:N-acetyl-gamma-glutamyl-phosphate reductase [Planctomycetes bacterium Pla133]QDV03375.1 N-acetyl-gamma-glutamyl-phosphate reductase [Planctomycetes bacterium Pla86]